jgi:hypothetical protein
MNLKYAQVAGATVAIFGFIFAGAYAVAGHRPEKQVQDANPSAPAHVHQTQVVYPPVPEASVVFKGNTDAPEGQPATF